MQGKGADVASECMDIEVALRLSARFPFSQMDRQIGLICADKVLDKALVLTFVGVPSDIGAGAAERAGPRQAQQAQSAVACESERIANPLPRAVVILAFQYRLARFPPCV